MDRREFLRKNGVLATTGLLTGCSAFGQSSQGTDDQTPTAASEPTTTPESTATEKPPTLREKARVPDDVDIEFDSVLNVRELGADPESKEPITDLLLNHIDDNTLLVFPEGRYRLGFVNARDITNFGMVSMRGTQPALVPIGPAEEIGEWLLALRGENILLNGFDIDFTAPGHGSRTQLIATEGNLWCKNIHVLGQIESQADAFKFVTMDSDGVGVVERVIARDGSPSDGGSSIGIFVGLDHAGELYIRDCEMWHFQGKGIYASNPAERASGAGGGRIHVEGGLYKNNNPANIRLGGGSTIRNVTFRNVKSLEGETVTWKTPLPSRHGVVNARSVRVLGDRNGHVLIDNCDFYHEIGSGAGVITVAPTGGAVVRDCNITLDDGNIPAVHLKPDETNLKPSIFNNVNISGEKQEGPTILVRRRKNTKFHNCEVTMPNSDGFKLMLDSSIQFRNTIPEIGDRTIMFDQQEPWNIHDIHMSRDTVDGSGEYRYVIEDSKFAPDEEDIINGGEISGTLDGVAEAKHRFVGDILQFDADETISVKISM